jgi:hypothetical protein
MSVSKNKEAVKLDSNYMILTFGYGHKVILPYKDAIVLLGALEKGEMLSESYGKETTIKDFDKDSVTVAFMGFQEYAEIKLKSILLGNLNDT